MAWTRTVDEDRGDKSEDKAFVDLEAMANRVTVDLVVQGPVNSYDYGEDIRRCLRKGNYGRQEGLIRTLPKPRPRRFLKQPCDHDKFQPY